MKPLLDSLRAGNWRSLLACFLYFDTGFTVWVLYGPLAPFIAKSVTMTAGEQGFLVAVPVLSAAILRVTLGNLYQSVNGRTLALAGIALSAVPTIVLPLLPGVPSYTLLLMLGILLGVGGASFAVALPMAGSSYPPKVQGLVLGLAAAGNIGAVLDGFLFPGLAARFGWQVAPVGALPLLAVAAMALLAWGDDRAPKAGAALKPLLAFGTTLAGLAVLVLAVHAGLFGSGKTGILLLPAAGAALAVAVLPGRYRAVLKERDTWALMLVYSVTFGGFVGMSSYVATLLTSMYRMPAVEAGLFMALLAFAGAMVRPLGGLIADRVTGVRALLFMLCGICLCDFVFAAFMPGRGVGLMVLFAAYVLFGLGNGATFQLVPNRWPGKTGLMSGLIGAAGGIGGFYLPVTMGFAKQGTGSFQAGFLVLGGIAALALASVLMLRGQWLEWAAPGLDRRAA